MVEEDAPFAVRRSSAQRHRARFRARWFFRGVRCAAGPPGFREDDTGLHVAVVGEKQQSGGSGRTSETDEQDDTMDGICNFISAIRDQRQEQLEVASRSLASIYYPAKIVSSIPASEPTTASQHLTEDVSSNECTMKEVEQIKLQGNAAILEGDPDGAVRWYSTGLRLAGKAKGLPIEQYSILYSNRAFAHIQLQQWSSAISDCDEALKLNCNNRKAIYRRAAASFQIGDIESAFYDVTAFIGGQPPEVCHFDDLELLTKPRLSIIQQGSYRPSIYFCNCPR
jgi:tetratricopeptide (TPR) repeat protein